MDPLNPGSPDVSSTSDQPTAASKRRRVSAVALIAVAVAAVIALALTQGKATDRDSTGKGGDAAPPFTLENIRPGEAPVSLEAMRGKPVVVNFWASWCVPCRREMPAFESVYEAVGDRVAFLGINHKDYRNSALDFLRQTGTRYPSGFDPAGTVAARYGIVGMPTTLFISGDGRLLEQRPGEMSGEELRQTISRLYGVT
jgi:cytochrome c biogenesis protein CcmG/thiol:disulfide interchange protein DsbE